MARAEIYLEDEGPGIALALREIGGTDPNSNAQRMARQLIKYLDDHADWKKDEIHETVDPQEHPLTTHNPGIIRL